VLKTDAGLVLICGCCHAGILNTLAHARSHFEGDMIAILGVIHLMPAEMPMIRKVISALQEMAPNARFWLNHCTGDDAQRAFAEAFGEQAHHFKAGESIRF
jgi:7,8-dihydropterin-6-yl-methyl-4-(beta-D-ribofuranosyl)aminobenzene 5'-phosphate synthase